MRIKLNCIKHNESSSLQFLGAGTETPLGTAAQSSTPQALKAAQGDETRVQGRCPLQSHPCPPVSRSGLQSQAPWPAHFVLAALFSQFCPGCAFLSALLSSRGDESRLGPAWLRGQSQVSRREPASYGFNILINFNTDAQMRVNHSAAVLSNLPSLFIKTFLPELWLNVMLFKGPLKQPGGFAGCCWNTFYNLLCKEECESALGEGWGTRLREMLL